MYCAQCGAENPDDAGQCVKCGASFDSPEKKRGWSTCGILAIVAVVVGVLIVAVIGILAAIAIPNYRHAQARAKIARTMYDQRNVGTALEAFHIDNNRLPTVREYNESGPLMADPAPGGASEATGEPQWLTRPVAYISSMPADPYREGDYHYGYWTINDVWILRSYGPDGVPSADLQALGEGLAGMAENRWNRDAWPANLRDMQYDPSNGLQSDGDLLLVQ